MKKFDEKRICELYKQEKSPYLIIKEFDCGKTTFYRILKRNKIKIFPKGYFHKGKVAWNKGLTKEDPRVKKYCEKGVKTRLKKGSYKSNSGTFEKGQTRARYPKGRKNPKLSEVRKRLWKERKLKRKFGKENHSWKGGIYKLNRQIRLSREYKAWRREIIKKDKNICQNCGLIGRDVHHKIPFAEILKKNNIKSYEQALDCKELWNKENCEVLCKKCHESNYK